MLSCTLHPEYSDVACVNLIPVSVLLGSEKAKKVEDEDTHGSIGLHSQFCRTWTQYLLQCAFVETI